MGCQLRLRFEEEVWRGMESIPRLPYENAKFAQVAVEMFFWKSRIFQVFAPNAPDCFDDWADQYGVISFHIFFKEHPRLTICSLGANDSACD